MVVGPGWDEEHQAVHRDMVRPVWDGGHEVAHRDVVGPQWDGETPGSMWEYGGTPRGTQGCGGTRL